MRRLTFPPRTLEILVASWFVVISAMRLSVMSAAIPGFDAKLYRTATLTWLDGGDPWSVYDGAIRFAAPPPSLLAMLPFALVPETVAVVAMIGLGFFGTAWALRRLGIPLWWLAFPPFVDGLYNANPHVLLIPLLVAGLAPLAALVKIYAVPVPVLLGEWKAVVVTAIVLLVTIPILPWASYIAQFPGITADLAEQSDGGMSALAIPVLIPVAVVALVLMGRRRAAWWVRAPALAEHAVVLHLAGDAGDDATGRIRGRRAGPVRDDARGRSVMAAEVVWRARRAPPAGMARRSPPPDDPHGRRRRCGRNHPDATGAIVRA